MRTRRLVPESDPVHEVTRPMTDAEERRAMRMLLSLYGRRT